MFNLDMHTHTTHFRKRKVKEIILRAMDRGCHGCVSTEHFHSYPPGDFVDNYRRFADMAGEEGFVVFEGAEITLQHMDFLVYGLNMEEILDAGSTKTIKGLIERVHSYGGILIQAHPLRKMKRTIELKMDGWELNGREAKEKNIALRGLGEALGLLITAGSDAHRGVGLGTVFTSFEEQPKDNKDLVDMIRGNKHQACI